jgi:rod shape-determining protein MreD
MIPYLLVLALGLAALVQVSLLPALQVGGVYPNLTLVVILAWALLRGSRSAIVWALIAGLWLDLLSSRAFGAYTLGLVVAAYLAGLGRQTVYRPTIWLALAMTALVTVVQDGIQLVLLWLNGGTFSPPDALLRLVLPEIVYNSIVMLAVYPVLSWVDRATGQERLPLE